jgi:hypothetical protein
VVIVQFAVTDAVTDRLEVAVAASVLQVVPIAKAVAPAKVSIRAPNFCLNMVSP